MIRTFIYGSCVSRDTFEYLEGHELVRYVARQSIISAYHRVREGILPQLVLPSAFQRRMFDWDARSRLVPLLRADAAGIDVLLWDLCDERLGVRLLGGRGAVTRSVDGMTAGFDAELESRSELADFGTDRHFALWKRRLSAWGRELDTIGLRERLVLVAPPWAQRSASGKAAPASFGRTSGEANILYERYVDQAVATLGCPVVTTDPVETLSDPAHRWGEAPFHYTSRVYEELAARIEDITGARSSHR